MEDRTYNIVPLRRMQLEIRSEIKEEYNLTDAWEEIALFYGKSADWARRPLPIFGSVFQLVALAAGFEEATEQDTLDRIADYEERRRHWKQALAGQQLLSSVMFVYGTQKAYGALTMQIAAIKRCITGDFPGQAARHAETIARHTHPLKLQQVRPSLAHRLSRALLCGVCVPVRFDAAASLPLWVGCAELRVRFVCCCVRSKSWRRTVLRRG
jgi:hypothetical protein